jgi:predicted NBD/HSP70 family sugar kinase
LWSPVFGGEQIDFAALLEPEWRAKVTLNNETLLVAQALGMKADSAQSGSFRTLAALSLGHSVGLGIARKDRFGELEATAPNFGHMLHAANGCLCRCGSFGCIEASAGFYGILRAAFEVPPDTIPAKFVPLAEMDKVAASARQGNRMAGYAFRQAGIALGNGLSRVLSLHERMPIYIGGPGTRYFDLLQRGIDEGLEQSHEVRLQGRPEISVIFDEQRLVFDGHLDRALTDMDHDIAAFRQLPTAADSS